MLWYYFLNFALLYPLFLALWLFALLFFRQLAFPPKRCAFYRRPTATTHSRIEHQHAKNHRKPNWIRHEILRLKAHMPQAGCRCVTRTFNRLHPDASVGKTFVAQLIAHHQHDIAELRRQIRSAQPRVVAVNHTWAMDLSFCTDEQQRTHAAVGILDHGSRLVTRLHTLTRRCSWSMLGHLCLAIAQHGKPRKLRTDNEAIFNSWVFKGFLKLAGIQHQTTQKHAPWQNGRIERLFGTLKPLLKQLAMPNGAALQVALDEFKVFYNHVRPHQNLQGLTPAEHFAGLRPTDLRQMPIKQVTEVQALAGLMRGYWIRR
jgi:transposase InsO family protein